MRGLPEIITCIVFAILSSLGFYYAEEAGTILPASMAATCALAIVLKFIIVQARYNFIDFFKGENNTYSLSRFQFFLWVLIIISSQIALITILVKEHSIERYNLVVGENVLWILAASFGTLLSVQGITSQKKKTNSLKLHNSKDLKDLIVEDGKLDFTRFQMLMWTVIAISVYYFQSVSYLNNVRVSLIDEGKGTTKIERIAQFNGDVSVISDKIAIVPPRTYKDSVGRWNRSIVDSIKNLSSHEAIDKKAARVLILQWSVLPDTVPLEDERSFLKTVQAKGTDWLTAATEKLASIQATIAAAFTDGDASVPDISVTFLILMGLVQGAYVGKKLLPVDSSGQPTNVLPGTFVPATAEGKKVFDDLKLKEAFAIAKVNYLPKSYVTGVDIGIKEVGDKPTGEKVIRIHVLKKIKSIVLDEKEKIPSEINGVPTDVIESTFKEQASTLVADRKTRVDPIQPGVSVGDDFSTGTLGLIVTDLIHGDKCILSNHHVLKSDSAYQPGLDDGGVASQDKVAVRLRSIKSEIGDASIFKITDTTRKIDPHIFGTSVILTGTKYPTSNTTLKKSGKETGITAGIVTSDIGVYKLLNSNYQVNGFLLSSTDGGPLTIPGDSGSVWFDDTTSEGVGLHIGIAQNGKALACLLTDVLTELKAKI